MDPIEIFDIGIIGGGINGCGIARDAAGRGLSVVLCEQNDLGSGTSSASSKLIHGGLRYLEHYEFALVRESLKEREILLRGAPHLVKPIDFILPHHPGLRSKWILRLGLILYDWLKGRSVLPGSGQIKIKSDLKSEYRFGFRYTDCWADDARLVIANALDAKRLGANVCTQSKCVSAFRKEHHWEITVDNKGVQKAIQCKTLVNATGPWLNSFKNTVFDPAQLAPTTDRIRLIQGSHIILPKWYEHDDAYLLQNPDNRIVFVIPYKKNFVLVGTTDFEFDGNPTDAAITKGEVAYLCNIVNHYFVHQVSPEDVVSTFSGVRPLYDDGSDKPQETTRDYKIKLDTLFPGAPMVTIYGGKLTTYRNLSENVVTKLRPYLPKMKNPWTDNTSLDVDLQNVSDFSEFVIQSISEYAFLDSQLVDELICRHGSNIHKLLANVNFETDMGQCFGHNLYELEVKYFISEEWATSVEDILWRRTKLGMLFDHSQTRTLADWFANLTRAN